VVRRIFPVVSIAGLIVIGMISSIWWPHVVGKVGWALPHDLWATMIAANRILHGNLAGLYTQPTGLITLPGGAVILVPVVAVIDAAGLSVHIPGNNAQPASWLFAGPYMTAISGIALFAADAIAERLAVSRFKRAVLAVAGAVLLWNVTVRWGHPEDAVAVGLLMYAVLALANGKTGRSGWLFGAAVAVQPLVLLALPVVLSGTKSRRVPGYIASAAAPGLALIGAAAAANWKATWAAVTSQPNWPSVDHPTLWLPLATHLHDGAVAAGPARLVAIAVACGCGAVVWFPCRSARAAEAWDRQTTLTVLWWVAVTLGLRSVFEPVMVAYYLWPAFAVAIVVASPSWPRLLATSVLAGTETFASQVPWRSPWTWWVPVIIGLAATLLLAGPPTALEEPESVAVPSLAGVTAQE
jgi:hypothetical protein